MAFKSFASCTLTASEGAYLSVKDYFTDKCVIAPESRVFELIGQDVRIRYNHSNLSKSKTYALLVDGSLHRAHVIDRKGKYELASSTAPPIRSEVMFTNVKIDPT